MQKWNCALAECHVVPSSCGVKVPLCPNSLTVLASGSQFVYILDTTKMCDAPADSIRRQPVAVLKFSAAVVHTCGMNFRDEVEVSMVSCCLADGQILAFSIEDLLNKTLEQSNADGTPDFAQPFHGSYTPRTSRRVAAMSAEPITACIGICPASEWILISAVVLDNNLYMCRRSRSTGDLSYVLLRSNHRNVAVPSGGRRSIKIPSFVGAVEIQSSVAGIKNSEVQRSMADCRPVFAIVQSEKHPPMCCGNIITTELFLSLFGPEFQLSGSPALIVGCQNGNIYFTGIGACQGSEQEFMSPLYSLAQSIVGIHTVYFPNKRAPEANDPFVLQEASPVDDSAESKIHNAVIFIGQAGKIAVCCVGSEGQFSRFQEFHVPAPVLSSVLVSGECLVYSTQQELYRICLRQECSHSMEERIPPVNAGMLPVVIPELSFKFPEMVQNIQYRTYLLHGNSTSGLDSSPAAAHGVKLQFLCMSHDGSLSMIHSTVCASTGKDGSGALWKSSTKVGQDLKQCLQCIQSHSEEIDHVMEIILSLNKLLVELKSAVDMLLAVRGIAVPHLSRCFCPFTCFVNTSREKFGTSAEKMCVNMKIACRKHKFTTEALNDDWSLLVITYSGKHSISKSVSLSGLVAGDSVSLAMDIEVGVELKRGVYIESFLLYSPQRLCRCLTQYGHPKKSDIVKGVSLFLAKKHFDVVDFLRQRKCTARETLSSCRSRMVTRILSPESTPTPPNTALPHSFSFHVSLGTATNTIQASSPSLSVATLQGMSPGEVATALLNVLIPPPSGKRKLGTTGEATEYDVLTRFDGEGIEFQLSSVGEDEGLQLEVRTSNMSMLVQIIGSLSARLRSGRTKENRESCEHGALCSKLEELKGVLEEVGKVQREISSCHQEWKTNCMSAEAYHKALLTGKARTCSIYCKLREIVLV